MQSFPFEKMPELESSIEFSEEQQSVLKQAFEQMEAGGAAAEAKTEEFEKKWSPDVARDVLPEKPKSAQALIRMLQLIPGVSLDQEAIGTLERTIFGSPRATGASLYETHTPGEASKDNSWIDVICSVRESWGEKRSFTVSLSRVVDLKDLTLRLEFDEDNISLQGGTIEELEHKKYPHRNLVQGRGVIKFDPKGRIENTRGSLENFKGSIDLPGLIANLTSRERIDRPLNPEMIIPVKKPE